MKKNIIRIAILIMSLIPFSVKAVSVNDARAAIVNYANFTYNEQFNQFSYSIGENGVNYDLPFKGKYNKDNTYALDCSRYVAYVIYHALQFNYGYYKRVAYLNDDDKWLSNVDYYKETTYDFKSETETVNELAERINFFSILEPGDVVGYVAYGDDGIRQNHLALYIGNGTLMHDTPTAGPNGTGGLKKGNTVSFPSRHGKKVGGKIKGGISILKLRKTDSVSNDVTTKLRYSDGNGNYSYRSINISGSSSSEGSSTSTAPLTYRDEVKKIFYLGGLVIFALRIVIPAVLLVFAIIELLNIVTTESKLTKGEWSNDEMKKIVKRMVIKFALALAIFILPTIISLIINITDSSEIEDANYKCLFNPSDCNVELWDQYPDE